MGQEEEGDSTYMRKGRPIPLSKLLLIEATKAAKPKPRVSGINSLGKLRCHLVKVFLLFSDLD